MVSGLLEAGGDSMMAWLVALDYRLLHLINVDLAHPILDRFWLTMTHLDRHWWFMDIILPLLLLNLIYLYRWGAVKVLLAVGLTVGLSDALAYRVIKHAVERPRPFHNPEISSWVRKVDDAHGSSFPSNHAANCFAGAVILAWYFRRQRHYFYTFASLVALSRPALGVHYPSDILAGAILGIFVANLVRIFLLQSFSWWRLHGETVERRLMAEHRGRL